MVVQKIWKRKGQEGKYFIQYSFPYETAKSKGIQFVDGYAVDNETDIPYHSVMIFHTPGVSTFTDAWEECSTHELHEKNKRMFSLIEGNPIVTYAVIDDSLPCKDCVVGVYPTEQQAQQAVKDCEVVVEVFSYVNH